ncbi:MAG: hypothetical protein Q8L69_15850, partial [Gallionellaceae bacterium]|nr:hypothetical protein [Gallionellaceae bacterium]
DIQDLNAIPPLSYCHCQPNIAKLNNQNNAYEKATWSVSNAKSNDASLAQTARSASNNALRVLDGQLISLTPSPDAILNAAKTLLPGGGISPSAISSDQARATVSASKAEPNGLKNSIEGPPIPDCSDQENSRLDERAANYQAITSSEQSGTIRDRPLIKLAT